MSFPTPADAKFYEAQRKAVEDIRALRTRVYRLRAKQAVLYHDYYQAMEKADVTR